MGFINEPRFIHAIISIGASAITKCNTNYERIAVAGGWNGSKACWNKRQECLPDIVSDAVFARRSMKGFLLVFNRYTQLPGKALTCVMS